MPISHSIQARAVKRPELSKKLHQVDTAIREWVEELDILVEQLLERKKDPDPLEGQKIVDLATLLGAINKRFKKITKASSRLQSANEKYLKEFEQSLDLPIPPTLKAQSQTKDVWESLKQKWIAKKNENQKRNKKDLFNSLVQQASKIVKRLNKSLKALSKAKQSEDVNKYLSTINSLNEEQQQFRNDFVEAYQNHVSELIEGELEGISPEETQESPWEEEVPPTKEESQPETTTEEIEVELPESWDETSWEEIPDTIPSDRVIDTLPEEEPATLPDSYQIPLDEFVPQTEPDPLASAQPVPLVSPLAPETQSVPSPYVTEIPPTQPSSREEITSGKGTARRGPVEVAVEAMLQKRFLEQLEKAASTQEILVLISKHAKDLSSLNPQKSAQLKSVANKIISNDL